nr:hypothetical protein [Alphaproteobacteria bacterium]
VNSMVAMVDRLPHCRKQEKATPPPPPTPPTPSLQPLSTPDALSEADERKKATPTRRPIPE